MEKKVSKLNKLLGKILPVIIIVNIIMYAGLVPRTFLNKDWGLLLFIVAVLIFSVFWLVIERMNKNDS